MKEQAIILCIPVGSAERGLVTAGSTVEHCATCGIAVHFAPSGQKFKEQYHAVIQCLECGLPGALASRRPVEVTKEQIEEIRRTGPEALYNLLSMIAKHRARNN